MPVEAAMTRVSTAMTRCVDEFLIGGSFYAVANRGADHSIPGMGTFLNSPRRLLCSKSARSHPGTVIDPRRSPILQGTRARRQRGRHRSSAHLGLAHVRFAGG